MKETSQRYLNSEAHGYLMEAKAYKLLLKDLERIRCLLYTSRTAVQMFAAGLGPQPPVPEHGEDNNG